MPKSSISWVRISYIGAIGAIILVVGLYCDSRCDYLIKDVQYLQGEKISEGLFNIGIKNGRITCVGTNPIRARTVIYGTGLILMPGLIDVNSCGWLSENAAELKLNDGITTFFNAHGDSFQSDAKKIKMSEKLNYATSVGLIPVFANHLEREKMFEVLRRSPPRFIVSFIGYQKKKCGYPVRSVERAQDFAKHFTYTNGTSNKDHASGNSIWSR